ncbi:hypothetical protein [Parasediminibacterium sp. JCM 36343]|uniref:hypothetical protein n=1 Tax=Parasediminibacterium sp. JCM 36343 TaxID=3374279 RepID=UPI00397D9844
MKTIITQSLFTIIILTSISANAQRGWERGNDRHEETRDNYNNGGQRGWDRGNDRHEETRGNYNNGGQRGWNGHHDEYINNDRRVVYQQQPQQRGGYYNNHEAYGYGYAQQPQRRSYYYYPQANVYFNPNNRLYSYYNGGGWVDCEVLPRGLCVNEPYSEVYCNPDEDIWAYNRSHINCYRQARPMVVERPRVSFSVGFRF